MTEWYPIIRKAILHAIWALSNKKHQQEGWLKQKNLSPGHEIDNFDQAVHWLFDDTRLADDPYGCIGWILIDRNEADLVKEVVGAVNEVIADVEAKMPKGTTFIPDEEFLNSPKWEKVVEAASRAWALMEGKIYPPK